MIIKVLGMGCPNCKRLEQNVKEALKELDLEAELQEVQDLQEIVSYGVMSTPALMIDAHIVSSGQVLEVNRIKELLQNKSFEKVCENKDCKSSCCDGCC